MTSLRDQLLKAGLVSAREKQKVERELKEERRKAQAHREAKNLVEAREQAERERARLEALQQRIDERKARQAVVEAEARRHQVDQLLSAHATAFRGGPQPFWHRTLDGRFCHRLDLPEWMAQDLRSGRAAVAARERMGEVDYVVIARDIALRVTALLPERLVFFNGELPDPADPSEKLL
jgi:uncharacterized protein